MQTVSGAMLLEPFIAQIAGIILGQDEIPGIYTMIGLLTISTGFFIAEYGLSHKSSSSH